MEFTIRTDGSWLHGDCISCGCAAARQQREPHISRVGQDDLICHDCSQQLAPELMAQLSSLHEAWLIQFRAPVEEIKPAWMQPAMVETTPEALRA